MTGARTPQRIATIVCLCLATGCSLLTTSEEKGMLGGDGGSEVQTEFYSPARDAGKSTLIDDEDDDTPAPPLEGVGGGNDPSNLPDGSATPIVPEALSAGLDGDGIARIYAPAASAPIAMEYGARHENGDRYNANHKFINYEVTGYYLTSNTEKIEMKTDGPNHSGCGDMPKCQWAEPRIDIANGKASISSEYPHPKNHPDAGCPSCKTYGSPLAKRWIGYKVIAYAAADGHRVYEQWLDPEGLDAGGRPANKWVFMMRETNTGQVMPNPKRMLPTGDRGLEAEIRMHGGSKTEMKFGKIQEIIPPATTPP